MFNEIKNLFFEDINKIGKTFGSIQSFNHVQLFAAPWTVAHQLLCAWNSPGKSTGVGSHSLLQVIFQGWNLQSLIFLEKRIK